MFRVNQPYQNLLVIPRFFFQDFWKKYINVCILKGEMPFKMHKIIYFFPEKKIKNNYVCLPYLKIFILVTGNTLFLFGLRLLMKDL